MKLTLNEAAIGVKGSVKLTVLDALTGKVIHVDEGPNMVLNTGIEDICHLIAGDTTVPVDLLPGQSLYHSLQALPRVPLYGQFGNSGTTPASTDASTFSNGTLDVNASSPTSASDIVKASAYFPVVVAPGQTTTDISAPPPTNSTGGVLPMAGDSGVTVPAVMISNPTYINNSVTVQFALLPSQGNGPGGTDVTYREVVLMSKIVDNPIQYRWFARRVFGDIIKNPTTIIAAEWTFTFIIVRESS